jgi:hypothetical protein
MWSRAAVLAILLPAASACVSDGRVAYEAVPTEAGIYALRLTTYGPDLDKHKAQLARQAQATCGRAYDLAVEDEVVTICTDECADFRYTTIATLSCEKNSA